MEIVLESGRQEQLVVQYSVVPTKCSHAGMLGSGGRNSLSHSKAGNAEECLCKKGECLCLRMNKLIQVC